MQERLRVVVLLAGVVVMPIAGACGGKTVDAPPWTGLHVSGSAVDKVDLLFAIDNSPSMADKQALLAQSIPDLLRRLLAPRCVSTSATCTTDADCSALGASARCDGAASVCWVPGDQACPAGTKLEFAPVHDLHVGIVSSSLGGGGSPDVCIPMNGDATHVDDHAHLLDRTSGNPEGVIANAKPLDGSGGNFLAWLPSGDPKNAGKTNPNVTPYIDGQAAQLTTDFQSLVGGVGEHGCGLEAQLESWYRFLIQPDPYDSIVLDSGSPAMAHLDGVDATLLKMRHDFLRPDSLVAIVQVTDEEDSWSDPLWLGGYGWTVRTDQFPGSPGQGVGPRGTSECDAPVDPNDPLHTGPNNPDCSSCGFPGNKPISGSSIQSDPNCQSCAGQSTTCQPGWYTTQQDGLNVRYTNDMKRRYGLDPQWSVQRYVDGLTLAAVPDRDHEAHAPDAYTSTQRNCTNPLFAASLPDGSDTAADTLCTLAAGPRTPDMIFYALLGGAPTALLKPSLGAADWTALLGKDPATFQQDGIDPHMIESVEPRAGLQAAGTTYNLGSDPANGREWDTLTSSGGIDLQYACTFQLPTPKDCTQAPFANACDCTGAATSSAGGPPLCDPANRHLQIRGKAYPTIRELRVAKALGGQAVVGSVCADDTAPSDTALSTYGYRPVMNALVTRLAMGLGEPCLPAALPTAADGTSTCHLLEVDPTTSNQAAGCTAPGLAQPQPLLLQQLAQQGLTPAGVACEITQLPGPSCESATAAGWCYATGSGACAQAIRYSPTGTPAGGRYVVLECPPPP